MKQLVEKLFAETQSLREQYLEKIQEWASGEFERLMEKADWTPKEWCEVVGVTPEFKEYSEYEKLKFRKTEGGRWSFPRGFYNTRSSLIVQRMQNEVQAALHIGREGFIQKAVENGEKHYKMSIHKLAFRIEKKNLNQETLTMKTSHIGVNIETIISDGEKSVRAFTIIASGPVQRPHYRYLIK